MSVAQSACATRLQSTGRHGAPKPNVVAWSGRVQSTPGTVLKTLHVIRHGATEMAAYMTLHKYGSPHQEPLRDPLLYDTVLTREGLRQAAELAPRVAALDTPPEAVLTSPLTRCLQTTVAACGPLAVSRRVPLLAEPLLRERVTLSSELGRPPGKLRDDFPDIAFPGGMPDVWWHTEGPGTDPWVVTPEPQDVYEARLAALRSVLAARPERVLLLVSHWGVLRALTGRELRPAELVSVQVELPVG